MPRFFSKEPLGDRSKNPDLFGKIKISSGLVINKHRLLENNPTHTQDTTFFKQTLEEVRLDMAAEKHFVRTLINDLQLQVNQLMDKQYQYPILDNWGLDHEEFSGGVKHQMKQYSSFVKQKEPNRSTFRTLN